MMGTGHRLFVRPPTPPTWEPIETTTAGESGSSSSSESESDDGSEAEEIDEDAAVDMPAGNGAVFGFRPVSAASCDAVTDAAVSVAVEEISPPARLSSPPVIDFLREFERRHSSGPPTPVQDEPSVEFESSFG
jgi:hypothetical protein